MSTVDVDMTLYLHKKHTPPPSVLLLTTPNSNDQYYPINPSIQHRSRQKKTPQPLPHMIGLHVNNLDIHDSSTSSYGWQRHSDKLNQLNPAPDVAYRYTYLEELKREKLNVNNNRHNHSPSPSPRTQPSSHLKLNNSFSYTPSESSQKKSFSHQYHNIYDYIRNSIRQIERQRNLKQQNITSRVQRPQNEDSTFRRVLADRKTTTRSSLSRSSSTTVSSLFNNDLKTPQNLVNYINHSRTLHPTTRTVLLDDT